MEEPPIQEVLAPESGVMEAPPQATMAQEHGVIPPAIVPEATTLIAVRIVPEVSATDLLRELPQFSSLPRLIEGRAFIIHVPQVPTSIASTALLSIPPLSGDVSDLLGTGVDTSPF